MEDKPKPQSGTYGALTRSTEEEPQEFIKRLKFFKFTPMQIVYYIDKYKLDI